MQSFSRFRSVVALATVATGVALMLPACSGRAEQPTACPRALTRLVTADPPRREIESFVDVTLSTDWTSDAYLDQLLAMATKAVTEGTAFRVVAFAESVAGTHTVLFCRTVAPLVRSEAGRATAIKRVTRILHDALRTRFHELRGRGGTAKTATQRPGVSGTDLYAVFRAIAETPAVAPARSVYGLTDGIHNIGPAGDPPRLEGTAVSVYDVGRLRGGRAVSTAEALRLARSLESWLRQTGADPVSVSTQPFTFGGAS